MVASLVIFLVAVVTSCARIFGGMADGGKPVPLAGLQIGMTDDEVEKACNSRATKQVVRRSYGGFDAAGRALPSTSTPLPVAPGEQRFLTHITCGSSAGLTDVSFAPSANAARALAIRHDDFAPVEKSLEASVKALTDRFGEPAQRATDKIVHSRLDQLSLEWVVPRGARDCRELAKRADEPNLEIPSDCGYVYTTQIFSRAGSVTEAKSSLADQAEMLRSHQRYLKELYAKQERP